jgi:UDP-N-acetylglucosamine diphosphorylase / glucose-1-phosphate thymidylyltransferase / UDP-N-acetylgalactosamine diphosphorylase / glucosamine-1-phosphate N-acetyltransferase / galactosamine-1-phosphate N-acetyltransferase
LRLSLNFYSTIYRQPSTLEHSCSAILTGVAAEITTAVLLAAGRGKRLGALTTDTPKPLLDIAGAPLISHIVDALAGAGLTRFIVVTGYLSAQIERWAKTYPRENPGINVLTVTQPELNGTGGAMLAARAHLAGHERFVFGWGDILMDRANYPRFVHHARNDEYDLMLAVNRVKDPFRGAAVYVDGHMTVERLDEKPAPGTAKTEWNNAGLFATGQIIFDYLARLTLSARGELELPAAIAQMIAGGRVVRAIDMRGFWSDVGTPEDLEAARAWFKPKRSADESA